jgi:hypothetical protein
MVVGAVEVRSGRKRPIVAGRIRLSTVPDGSAKSLDDFVQAHIAPGTAVMTDDHQGYVNLSKVG